MTDEAEAGTNGRRYGQKTVDQRRTDRRSRLLDTALELFGTDGFRGTTIEALCSRAGVSTRNFYEEFSTREALLIALHDDLNLRALTSVVASLADVDPLDIRMRASAATRAYLDVMTSDRRWARIALVESVGVSQACEQHRRAAVDQFVALIELEADRRSDEGVIAKRNHHLTAVALAGALNGLVSTWTADDEWAAQVPEIATEASRLIVLALES